MSKQVSLALALGLVASLDGGAKAVEPAQGDEKPSILYLFLTPECRDGPEAARRAKDFLLKNGGKVRLRPALLVRDFVRVSRMQEGEPLHDAMKELGKIGPLDIPLYDEEGLNLAAHWKVDVVPTFVLVTRGKAHRMSGARADLEEVYRCER